MLHILGPGDQFCQMFWWASEEGQKATCTKYLTKLTARSWDSEGLTQYFTFPHAMLRHYSFLWFVCISCVASRLLLLLLNILLKRPQQAYLQIYAAREGTAGNGQTLFRTSLSISLPRTFCLHTLHFLCLSGTVKVRQGLVERSFSFIQLLLSIQMAGKSR